MNYPGYPGYRFPFVFLDFVDNVFALVQSRSFPFTRFYLPIEHLYSIGYFAIPPSPFPSPLSQESEESEESEEETVRIVLSDDAPASLSREEISSYLVSYDELCKTLPMVSRHTSFREYARWFGCCYYGCVKTTDLRNYGKIPFCHEHHEEYSALYSKMKSTVGSLSFGDPNYPFAEELELRYQLLLALKFGESGHAHWYERVGEAALAATSC